MKKIWTRRLSLLLCAALFLPMLLFATPTVETQAASVYKMKLDSAYCVDAKGNYSTTNVKLQVEAGQKFVVADWVTCYDKKWNDIDLTSVKGVKYKSSKSGVAAVTSQGVVTTKKTGTTKMTIKKGKFTIKFELQVVKKGSLTKLCKNSAAYQKAINAAISTAGTKVTVNNADAFYNALVKAETENGKTKKLYYGANKKGRYSSGNKIVIPQYATYTKYKDQFASLIGDKEKISFTQGSASAKTTMLNASSITMASNTSGTVQLKNKIGILDYVPLYRIYVGSYNFTNQPGSNSSYKELKAQIDAPYTIKNAFGLISQVDGTVYNFDLTINYGSAQAALTLEKSAPSGTYTLTSNAQKYLGNITVTIP
jgi:hypothetical protein